MEKKYLIQNYNTQIYLTNTDIWEVYVNGEKFTGKTEKEAILKAYESIRRKN